MAGAIWAKRTFGSAALQFRFVSLRSGQCRHAISELIDSQDPLAAWLTVAEIRRGILEIPKGKKRSTLEAWFAGPEGPQALFADRVLPFGEKAGLVWANLMPDGRAKGRPRSALDTIIAAIAEAHHCVVVTDNEKDFEGVPIINPLRSSAS